MNRNDQQWMDGGDDNDGDEGMGGDETRPDGV